MPSAAEMAERTRGLRQPFSIYYHLQPHMGRLMAHRSASRTQMHLRVCLSGLACGGPQQ